MGSAGGCLATGVGLQLRRQPAHHVGGLAAGQVLAQHRQDDLGGALGGIQVDIGDLGDRRQELLVVHGSG